MRKQNKSYSNYCPEVKLRISSIFCITFSPTWHRFKFPTTKYFMYIFIVHMKVLITIYILSVTLLVCIFSGVFVRHEPETQGYLVIPLLYEALQLHAQYSHYPQSCNLCHPGKMLDCLSK
jgi:hypothetical protein